MFAEWLDNTMANRKVKGRDLARALDVHDSAVSRWKSGQGMPSLQTVMKIAEFFDVDPLRLAVTANLMDGKAVGIEPLPVPEPTARREYVRRQIQQIKGLTDESRRRLLETYDELAQES